MNTILTWLLWSAPAVQAVCALVIARRLTWRRQPALLAYLVLETYSEVLGSADLSAPWRDALRLGMVLAMLIARPLLIQEMMTLSRVGLSRATRAGIAAVAIAVCAWMAGSHPWTLDYQASALRSYARLASAAAAVAILVYRWLRPALEQHAESYRHKVYRIGVTCWLVVEAIQGSFVRGGLGLWLVSYTPERWTVIGVASCSAVMACVIGLAVAMAMVAPRRRVEKMAMMRRSQVRVAAMGRAA